MENAEAGFSVSDEAKGTTILENASGRLDEVDQLTQQDDVDAAAVSQTLTAFADQATEASELLIADYEATGSEDSINDLRDFAVRQHRDRWRPSTASSPRTPRQALLAAAQVLFEIDSLAANLCPLCESTGITEIPVPLLASGDARLDDAAVEAGQPRPSRPSSTDKGPKPDKGDKGPVTGETETGTETTPDDPIQLPTQAANGDGQNGNGQPENPLGSAASRSRRSLPSVGVPEVDQVVEDVVEGVNGSSAASTGP